MLWLLLIGSVSLLWIFGPKERFKVNNTQFTQALLDGPFSELHKLSATQAQNYLLRKESKFTDIVDDSQSKIKWLDGETKQPFVVVFVHGFSATHQEISPVPQDVAKSMGANLLLPRLHGHGRHSKFLKESRAEDWLEQMWETINIAACLGEQVILIGNSTGATLITWLIQQQNLLKTLPCQIHSLIFISPNFEVKHKAVGLLTLPWAKYWMSWFAPTHQITHPKNAMHAKYWTSRYSIKSVYPLQVLIDWVKKSNLQSIKTPTLFIYNEFDPVVNSDITSKFFKKFGSDIKKVELWRIGQYKKSQHVIAGDIVAKENNSIVIQMIADFLKPIMKIKQEQSKLLEDPKPKNESLIRGIDTKYDVIILGGGINGIATAWELAQQGQKILLIEQDDLAGKTSSNSSKLIHGGLRYLQQKEFSLVRNALKEREELMLLAPYLVRPLSFLIPKTRRKTFLLFKLGLWIYDHLYFKKTIRSSKQVKLTKWHGFAEHFKKAMRYYDCQCDDARLVIELAKSCRQMGVDIRPQMSVKTIDSNHSVSPGEWSCLIQDKLTQCSYQTFSKVMINACGPWANKVHDQFFQEIYPKGPQTLRLVRGSHIVVNKISNDAFLLPNEQDGRIVFVLPYQTFSIIGTTEVEQTIDDPIKMSKIEKDYLLNVVNQFVKKNIRPSDILNDYAGIRPLVEDHKKSDKALSREFKVTVDSDELNKKPILVNLLGGKITTFRLLAKQVYHQLIPFLNSKTPIKLNGLIGSNLSVVTLEKRLHYFAPYLDKKSVTRLIRAYGRSCLNWFNNGNEESLGHKFAKGVYQTEIDYLINQEWVFSVEDLLKRRTRFNWQLSSIEQTQLNKYIQLRLSEYDQLGFRDVSGKIHAVSADLSSSELLKSQFNQFGHQIPRA
ncbi:glycerol-3-phosphate dehydrogenase [Marinicellulosiphila megalodicopiae]|uniref:glycerol-3-phosphate dehydrogenase n=1 Tax=Marinicellulosiphila megalodicopiae TaxID=2724896 RepID=UPI003BB1F6A8